MIERGNKCFSSLRVTRFPPQPPLFLEVAFPPCHTVAKVMGRCNRKKRYACYEHGTCMCHAHCIRIYFEHSTCIYYDHDACRTAIIVHTLRVIIVNACIMDAKTPLRVSQLGILSHTQMQKWKGNAAGIREHSDSGSVKKVSGWTHTFTTQINVILNRARDDKVSYEGKVKVQEQLMLLHLLASTTELLVEAKLPGLPASLFDCNDAIAKPFQCWEHKFTSMSQHQ